MLKGMIATPLLFTILLELVMDVEFSVLQERPPRGARHQRRPRKVL
jgi:hypothetical protein